MVQQLVRGGQPVDIPSTGEIGETVDARLAAFYERQRDIEDARARERYRGLKRMELYLSPPASSATWFTGSLVDEGYVWSLRLASFAVSASGTFIVYRASADKDTRRPIGQDATAGTTHIATWSSDQARLRHGDGLYLVPSTGNVTGVFISAWQLPAEREGEFA